MDYINWLKDNYSHFSTIVMITVSIALFIGNIILDRIPYNRSQFANSIYSAIESKDQKEADLDKIKDLVEHLDASEEEIIKKFISLCIRVHSNKSPVYSMLFISFENRVHFFSTDELSFLLSKNLILNSTPMTAALFQIQESKPNVILSDSRVITVPTTNINKMMVSQLTEKASRLLSLNIGYIDIKKSNSDKITTLLQGT